MQQKGRMNGMLDGAVRAVTAPVQSFARSVLESISSTWHHYLWLVYTAEDNQLLSNEVDALKVQLMFYAEAQAENKQLKDLLELKESKLDDDALQAARVIAFSPTPLFHSIRVDRGEKDGIQIGDAVLNAQGVVGRVVAVNASSAEVMLIVDRNSSLDVINQRTREVARARGIGDKKVLGLELEYVSRSAEVEPGDLIVTSGVGTVFPKGLIVGRVTEVAQPGHGLFQGVKVEPSVNFGQLESVLLVKRWQSPSFSALKQQRQDKF
jgi:rod shape-determining protein MreC